MVSDSEQPKIAGLRKRDSQVVACILIMTVCIGFMEIYPALQPMAQAEELGTYVIQSWVPYYILYDPPGNGSFAQFSTGESEVLEMSFSGNNSALVVTGEFNASINRITGDTLGPRFISAVMLLQLNQTWEVCRYSRLGHEWTEAHLVNCSIIGFANYDFDEISGLGIWIDSLSNTTSDYNLSLYVAPGTTKTATIECQPTTPQSISAGYNITLMNSVVPISVSVCPQKHPFTIKYEFHDETMALSIHLFSDAPITPEPYRTEGPLIWF